MSTANASKIPFLQSCPARGNPVGGDRMKLVNPGDLDRIIAEVLPAEAGTADAALLAAQDSFPGWSAFPAEKRISILEKALDLLHERREAAAQTISAENGKPLSEARQEVSAALRDAGFQLRQANRMPVRELLQEEDGAVAGEVWHQPAGVFLLITPWNFPLATVLRKVIPALAWGNTAAAKPALQTPMSALLIYDCLKSAGLPEGVLQLVFGRGSEIGNILTDHPAVAGISFTGSTEVGLDICRRTAGRNVRLQMEMGGKNAMVVLGDADLEAAVKAVVTAAFTCSGQWCTSTSRVIVEEAVYEDFCNRLVHAVSQLRMGSGFDPEVTFGPVASRSQLETALNAISTAKEEGARLIFGGRSPEKIKGRRGYFIEPAVLADVTETMQLFREEVFGPVLAVCRSKNADEALRLSNASPYGLSFSVFTADPEKAGRFLSGADCGMVHHNLHTAHRHPALPITGWKESGRGIPECGLYARDFYTRVKAVYRYRAGK